MNWKSALVLAQLGAAVLVAHLLAFFFQDILQVEWMVMVSIILGSIGVLAAMPWRRFELALWGHGREPMQIEFLVGRVMSGLVAWS